MRVMASIGRLDFNGSQVVRPPTHSPDAWCRSYAFHNYTIHICWTPEVPHPSPQGFWGINGLLPKGYSPGMRFELPHISHLFSTDHKKGLERLEEKRRSSPEFHPLFVLVPGGTPHNLFWGSAHHEGVPFSALGVHKTVAISQAERNNRQGQRTSPS